MRKIAITELAFRDAHQSLLATRMKIDDMLAIANAIDEVGFHSIESWGGATFDACIRYLNEDPFKRLALLKEAMPKTPQQMLIRGQNLLGYRHYADDMVDKFVERAVHHGMDIFRIFDALNDTRNLKQTIAAVIKQGAHAQGTLCYTTSPFHNQKYWLDLAIELEAVGCHSLCIKDMSGILLPNTGFKLIQSLKSKVSIPIFLHSHATSGLASMTLLKAVEADIDGIDTAISPLSMTYSHSATESMITAIEDFEDCTTGIDLEKLIPIAAHFKIVRKKYAEFEGELKGVDARIIHSQVPGGMLTNLESQLSQAGLLERIDEVIDEIPRVRKDLGYIPLVTPTSQIVGTQAVINVTMNERYKNISKEVQGLIKGEYGKAPSEFNPELVKRVLGTKKPISVRPADLIEKELNRITNELKDVLVEKDIDLEGQIEVVDAALIYAMFPQVGLAFLENKFSTNSLENSNHEKSNPKATPSEQNKYPTEQTVDQKSEKNQTSTYHVKVNGEDFEVTVSEGSERIERTEPQSAAGNQEQKSAANPSQSPASGKLTPILAPLTGNVLRVEVKEGSSVKPDEVIVVLEAMKMEVEVKAEREGIIKQISVKVGDTVNTNKEVALIE